MESTLQRLAKGFRKDYGIGGEDNRSAMIRAREIEGKQAEAPKMVNMVGAYPTQFRARELLGQATPAGIQARNELDMGLSSNPVERIGQGLGTLAADITQDGARRFYWLLNALQATGEVINETALAKANPRLYGKSPVLDENNNPVKVQNKKKASDLGVLKEIDGRLRPKRGYSVKGQGDEAIYEKRNFEPGFVQSLSIPTGIAINSGLGLLTPFGGAEGYYAALPSDDDPTKTSNVLGEVGLKYFMGRTGNMLPYEEFVKVRPDVSPSEYGMYKAFKYDKKEDWNPLDDGQTTMLGGAIKTTTEGIHGPELQFLGRGLPVTTGVVPFVGALAGGVAGVKSKRPIRHGFGGGMAGLAVGQIAGNLLEQERRRRNAAENELNGPQY